MMLTKLIKSSVRLTTGLVLSAVFLVASMASAEVVDPQMELLVQELRSALGDDDSVKSLLTNENTGQTADVIEPVVAAVSLTDSNVGTKNSNTILQANAQIINVGDRLRIFLPGEEELNNEFSVDATGFIELPEIGDIPVSGLTLAQAIISIRQALSRVYRDVSRLDVVIKQHRLLITVLGFVENPGQINLAENANIQMALSLAGGLKSGAQLDKMQLKRNGEIIVFDYKAYLDSGDESLIPTLKTMDNLFVPSSPLIGNVQAEFDAAAILAGGDASEDKTAIKVFGEVANAGLFTFKKESTVIDLLMRAGGVTRYAGVEQIRVINNNIPSIFNLKAYLDNGESEEALILSEGATIFVPIAAKDVKVGSRMVYVMGEVQKPGAFENQDGATFLDILANAGGPTRFAETRQIRLLRANGMVIPFDLQDYTEKGSLKAPLPEILAGDAIFVPEKTATDQNSWLKVPSSRAIYIMGAVRSPGRYEWSDEMNIFDLLAHAGGPEGRADISATQVIMRHPDGKVETKIFDLALFHEEGGHIKDVPVLKAGYTVMVPELPQDPTDNKAKWLRQSAERSIYILGQVNSPGRYAFDTSMQFLDILSAADGPSAGADIHNIRVMHRNETGARISKLNLAMYFETGDESLLPKVVPGDTIYIPEKNRNWLDEEKETTIRVLGSVAKPGRYRFNDNMTLLDLLAQAGGPNDDAYVEKIVVVNASCCKEQSTSFDLVAFVKNPDFAELPVLREGDTVYVPNMARSNWRIFMDSVKDTLSIVTLYALAAVAL
jgi:protein involved in polysaccharide export with SLBB domain